MGQVMWRCVSYVGAAVRAGRCTRHGPDEPALERLSSQPVPPPFSLSRDGGWH